MPLALENGSGLLADVRVHGSALPAGGLTLDADGFARVDIAIRDGLVASLTPAARGAAPLTPAARGAASANGCEGLGGRIVMPAFVDCHTHLDKGHIWPRRPNPDGTFMGALQAAGDDRTANWNARDLEARMEFALKCAYAHGTKAIRTHLDCIAPQEDISFPVFMRKRAEWAGRIELQAACLFGIDSARDANWFKSLAQKVAAAGGVMGAVTYMVPDLDALLDRVFGAAAEHGLDLDFHADETDALEAVSLRRIAEAAARHDFQGKILVGHCCALARQPSDEVRRTLDAVAARDISVVSLPMCNMYLQDRRTDGTTPRWRGVTLLHEMKARGINVMVASDNTRDPFYAYGDLDMLEVYRMATRTAHFDHPVADWPKTVGANPANAMRIDAGQIAVGAKADMVLFKGRSWTELLSRPESGRVVIRDGKPLAAEMPDYCELDHLMV